MNYIDFMNMQPEFVLVLGLIIVFFADFFAHRNAERKQSLWMLTFGTFIVVIMAESWAAKQQRIAGEFYMLILSTLLGMFMMMSAGSFLLFFLGLEMASVPLACMVAFDRHRK